MTTTSEINGTAILTSAAASAADLFGHGTHVAGIIAGNSSLGYIGTAPRARVYSVKVSDDQGRGTASDLIKGIQWVSDHAAQYHIKVVNLSIQSEVAESYRTSPVAAAVETLWKQGVVVVAASGNRGSYPTGEYYAPSNDPYVISVGALDDNGTISPTDDLLATFSSRGTSQDGYYRPDIVAPGRKIASNLAPLSAWTATFPDRVVDGRFIAMSGTSFAAPVVSGAVALILEKYNDLTPDQVKWLIVNSGRHYAAQPDSAPALDIRGLFTLASRGIPSVHQSFPVNQYLADSTGSTTDQIYWDQIYWDQIYWDQSVLPL